MNSVTSIKKAPWAIKVSLALFIVYDIFNILYCFIAKDITVQFLAITSIQLLLLYGVVHKIAWSRDVFVGLYLLLIPFLMALLATSILNTHYLSLFGALIVVHTLPLAALVLLYTQPSDVWFNQPLHSENASVKVLWPAQFVIIIVALGLGFIALLIESKINLPLIKADHLSHISSMTVKLTIFHLNQTFGLLCSWVLLIAPISFFLALWKNYNLILLTRLMMIGIVFSLIFRDLATKNLSASLYTSWIMIFFVHLFLVSFLVYFSLSSGKKARSYALKFFTCKKKK